MSYPTLNSTWIHLGSRKSHYRLCPHFQNMLLPIFDNLCKKTIEKTLAQNPITSAIIRVINLPSLVLPWAPHPHGKRPDGLVSPEMSLKRTIYIYILLYIHLEQPSTSMLHALILQPIDMRCFFWRNEWPMNHEWITNDWRMNEDFAGPLILSSHNRINRSTSTAPRPTVQ